MPYPNLLRYEIAIFSDIKDTYPKYSEEYQVMANLVLCLSREYLDWCYRL